MVYDVGVSYKLIEPLAECFIYIPIHLKGSSKCNSFQQLYIIQLLIPA